MNQQNTQQHVLLFDLDGTLLDSNNIWDDADLRFLANHDFELTQEYHDGVANSILRNSAAFTKQYLGLDMSINEIIAEWMALIKDGYEHATLKPYAKEYLDQCRDKNYRMAILTACVPEHCEAALTANGLRDYFEKVIYAQCLNIEKKSPEIFKRVAEILGTTPENMTLFDDSLTNCKSAKTAGLTTIGVYDERRPVNDTEIPASCDIYINSFKSLLHPTF